MIWKWFGAGKSRAPARHVRDEQQLVRDVKQLVQGLPRAALHVMTTIPRGTSFLRGAPSIAPDPWPVRNGRKLDFLAQIDLAQVQAALQPDWLPREGALLFFYDFESYVMGSDVGSQDCWAVIYQPVASRDLAPRESPAPSDPAYARVPVMFRPILRYPTRERLGAVVLDDEERFTLQALADAEFGANPKHQFAGTPYPVQDDDMERLCQRVSSGGLEKGAADWRLLLQLDTDDSVSFNWISSGMSYFFVRESQARVGDFSNAWMVIQCT
jgi:uncharacterized protein YwqG